MDGSPLPRRYTDVELIGEGGFGRVYRARDTNFNRWVAAKVAIQSRDATPDIDAFVLEARRAASLEHPNIIGVYDLDFHEDHLFLTMQFASGGTLDDVLQMSGAIDPVSVGRMISQAAAGLGYAHDEGLVHRDVKPSNLLIDSHGAVKVSDFGLVREVNRSTTHFGGTVAYMAPEQWTEAKKPTPAADVFALAVTAYELLTGARHGGFSTLASGDPPPRVSAVRTEISPEVDDVLDRALELKRLERTDDVRIFASALRDALNDVAPRITVIRVGPETPDEPAPVVAPRVARSVAGVKWSGAAKSSAAAKAIKIATIEDGVAEIVQGLDRDEAIAFLDDLGDRSDRSTIGIDFAFSLPGWYMREEGFASGPDAWAAMSSLAKTNGSESQWPREELGFPFWGANIRQRPDLPRRDMWFRHTEEHTRSETGMPPQSVFRLSGQGSVGSQSVRGMPYLTDLSDAGWSIWPFEEPGAHNVVEVFPSAYRVLVQYQWLNAFNDPHSERTLISLMDAELDLDASVRDELESEGRVVSALLAAWLLWREPDQLPDLSEDANAQLEGRIWLPSVGL
jgi:hypothetical protein